MTPNPTGITWYNDAASKATLEAFKAALQPLLDRLMPGFTLETLGVNKQNDFMHLDELVQLRLHLRRQIGRLDKPWYDEREDRRAERTKYLTEDKP